MKNTVATTTSPLATLSAVASVATTALNPFSLVPNTTERSGKERFATLWPEGITVVKKASDGKLYVKQGSKTLMTLAEADFLLQTHMQLKQSGTYVSCSRKDVQNVLRFFSPDFQPAKYISRAPDMKKMMNWARAYIESMEQLKAGADGSYMYNQSMVTSEDLLALKYNFDCVDKETIAQLNPDKVTDKDTLYADPSTITALGNTVVNYSSYANAMSAANRAVTTGVEAERRNRLNQLYTSLSKYYELCQKGNVKALRPTMHNGPNPNLQLPIFDESKTGVKGEEVVMDSIALYSKIDMAGFTSMQNEVRDVLKQAVSFEAAKQVIGTLPVAKEITPGSEESTEVKDFIGKLKNIIHNMKTNQGLLQLFAQ